MPLVDGDPLFFLSDAELMVFAREAMRSALSQVGKPLSISIAGRSLSYGSAAEAMNVLAEAERIRGKQLENRATGIAQTPFMGMSRWRG